MRRFVICALVCYLFLSLVASALYALLPSCAWDIATHRCGLSIVTVENGDIHMLNPFTNYGDDWL